MDILACEENMNKKLKDSEFNLRKSIMSSPLIFLDKKIEEIVEIYLNESNKNILEENRKLNFNIVYFIYVYDPKLIEKKELKNYRTVIFSEKELNKIKQIKKKIKLDEEPTLKSEKEYQNLLMPNEYIKFQHINFVKNWRLKNN